MSGQIRPTPWPMAPTTQLAFISMRLQQMGVTFQDVAEAITVALAGWEIPPDPYRPHRPRMKYRARRRHLGYTRTGHLR